MVKDPLVGQRFGSFIAIERLGGGAMGTVYLARHPHIGSRVAIKVLHPHLAGDPKVVARFQAEGRVANRLHHEHVVSVLDLDFAAPDRHYLLMEYLEGRTLSELPRPLELKVALHVLGQVCSAVSAAHAAGVVHRDLKPENVRVLTRGGDHFFVKVLDFGTAKVLDDCDPALRTATGQPQGTPQFMAPEQAAGEVVDARADQYALGVLAYELVTGRLPFEETTVGGLLTALRERVPVAPASLVPSLPPHVSGAIMRALAKAKHDRWPTVDAFREALELPAPRRAAPLVEGSPVWSVRIFDTRGEARALTASALDLDGVTVRSRARPPVSVGVGVGLRLGEFELRVRGRVVAHLPTEGDDEAGFRVAFEGLDEPQRRALARALDGQPLEDQPETLELLRSLEAAPAQGHARLGLPPDAPLGALQDGLARAVAAVRERLAHPVRVGHLHQLEVELFRLEALAAGHASHERRLATDAEHGNWRGVLRALAEGATAEQVQAARRVAVAARPRARAMGEFHATTAEAWRQRGELARARAELECALARDPLNLHYLALYQQLREGPASGGEAGADAEAE